MKVWGTSSQYLSQSLPYFLLHFWRSLWWSKHERQLHVEWKSVKVVFGKWCVPDAAVGDHGDEEADVEVGQEVIESENRREDE